MLQLAMARSPAQQPVRQQLFFDAILLGEVPLLLYVSAKNLAALVETYLLLISQHVQHHAVSTKCIGVHELSPS